MTSTRGVIHRQVRCTPSAPICTHLHPWGTKRCTPLHPSAPQSAPIGSGCAPRRMGASPSVAKNPTFSTLRLHPLHPNCTHSCAPCTPTSREGCGVQVQTEKTTNTTIDGRTSEPAEVIHRSSMEATVTIPAPKNPTALVDCPKGCGATVHRTDWDDNHGFHTHPRHIDPQPLTQPETIACIIAGRPIHTWRTDIVGRHWHGAPSRWHHATRHAPAHVCGHAFPAIETEQPFELEAPTTDDTFPF